MRSWVKSLTLDSCLQINHTLLLILCWLIIVIVHIVIFYVDERTQNPVLGCQNKPFYYSVYFPLHDTHNWYDKTVLSFYVRYFCQFKCTAPTLCSTLHCTVHKEHPDVLCKQSVYTYIPLHTNQCVYTFMHWFSSLWILGLWIIQLSFSSS